MQARRVPRLALAAAFGGILALGAPAAGRAQPTGPAPGSRIRIHVVGATAASLPGNFVPDARMSATLVAADSVGVTVRTRNGWQYTVPRGDVGRLERRVGASVCSGRVVRTACVVTGAVAGAALGELAVRASCPSCPRTLRSDGTRVPVGDEGGTVGGPRRRLAIPIGVVAGVVVGSLFGQDRWQQVRGWPWDGRARR